ncbi:phosphogluconate dehydratase [Pontixanthobacter aestiaquae]|uniref:Phosphogluconate dehydratase n=1 Tax=Pontixanthobacter aestiaquae TaxID=1509367 RepID=A0A844Z2A2_9SPHN|nr:phosphogluconate dehydratase [Pontixanthobacter aestiaquae]MDN3646177.1 phosphogluconate dehydratase [Pontixanthobacter aestiaquae]MXO82831.1 phosphogluconate dehydratase [Pontixanthobacter aestiaquae]
MSNLHDTLHAVTQRVIQKSRGSRSRYLELIKREADNQPDRNAVSCSNLAHAYAGAEEDQKALMAHKGPNIGIVSAYNDMLSAHQPYGRYPERLKIYAREVGATAQVAGATPAMCDGVTQGENGMELSLFSRDVIALSTGVALSHAMYDGALMLGICDKIVPGLLIGALRFGHLPAIFVPSGPMPSGISNKQKQATRQLYAEGRATRAELLASEIGSYHSPGTCTFYGTANSNQMMMEMMGLHIPGAAFIQPGTKLRQALDREAVHRVAAIGLDGNDYRPIGRCVDEKAIINAAVGLLATGGSTNHAIHIPAMARAAGVQLDWTDLSELSSVVPLLARVYPNGSGDVNHFHDAGGMGYVIKELLGAGLAHQDVLTVGDSDLSRYGEEPGLDGDALTWREVGKSGDDTMLRPASDPFQKDGGMRLVEGNLGRATFKTSAVSEDRYTVEAPCRVFDRQEDVTAAFQAGELDRDVVVVVRFQGPRANGMPELHSLTPPLAVLQDRGYKVALVTDGRMSGASGKVPAAIHCTPEALGGGPLAKLQTGDVIRLCANTGALSTPADLDSRPAAPDPVADDGFGRELFAMFRSHADGAEQGGSSMLAQAGL